MTERIDVLDENGLRTGEILKKKDIHIQGKYHRAVHLYLFNSAGEILLQRRSLTKDHFPGMLAISLSGHVNTGESSLVALKREFREEFGIEPETLDYEFFFSFKQEAILNNNYIDKQFNDIFICYADLDPKNINFSREEISEIIYLPFSKFKKMVSSNNAQLAPCFKKECKDLCYLLKNNSSPKMNRRPRLTKR